MIVETHDRPRSVIDDERDLAIGENRNIALAGSPNSVNAAIGDAMQHLMCHLHFARTPTFMQMPEAGLEIWKAHVLAHVDQLVSEFREPPSGEGAFVDEARRQLGLASVLRDRTNP